jgi:hypothetical protein
MTPGVQTLRQEVLWQACQEISVVLRQWLDSCRYVLSVPLAICSSDDQMKNDWMGGACGMYLGEGKCMQGFGVET